MFGTGSGGSSSPFGQTPAAGGGGLFGNVGGEQQKPTGTFSPSAFGTAGGQQSAFGSGSKLNKPDQTSSSSSLFGNTTMTPNKPAEPAAPGAANPFGSATPAATGGGNLFNRISTTPAGPPPSGQALFGNKQAEATTTAPAQNAFGNAGAFANMFSQNQNKKDEAPAAKPGIFNAPAASQPSGSPFTMNAPSSQGSLFPSTTTASSAPSFPTPTSTADSAQKPVFPSFGGTLATSDAAKPAATTTQPAPSGAMFSGLSKPETATTTPSLFPSSAKTTATESPKPATAGGGLFPAVGKSTATESAATPAPSGGMFSLGKTTGESTATPAAPSGGMFPSLGKPATTTSAPATAPTPATTTATAGAPTTTTATAPNTTTAAAGTAGDKTGLGASTVGPTPPAQSRLKNKTMDEIITRWATDLTKYQKEFQEQAEQVAEWDRLLVENAAKTTKLLTSTNEAERATLEVERQLSSVEGQQDELSAWLDRYEVELDNLLTKGGLGDTLQGPDQERERTYKLAERLSERLNEVGQDLTSMIEEVNTASASLSKTSKADEPISQIVRILNSHLSQLQVIDQGTSNLRSKINAAQKAGSSMGAQYGGYRDSLGRSVGGSGAAEDFYKAYMGRR